jgi:hypothetical protein
VMDGLNVMSRKECGVGERVKCRLACLREIGRRAPLGAWDKAAVEDTSTLYHRRLQAIDCKAIYWNQG